MFWKQSFLSLRTTEDGSFYLNTYSIRYMVTGTLGSGRAGEIERLICGAGGGGGPGGRESGISR